MDSTLIKQNGVHYTPAVLADFLALQIRPYVSGSDVKVLDPACGDGQLLVSMVGQLQNHKVSIQGFDTDAQAAKSSGKRLQELKPANLDIKNRDFLEHLDDMDPVDCVISNPPYVRTQVLGSRRSQQLASRFQLNGRVDLYQAFTAAIASVLRPGGVMGLLTSNRFLSVKAGRTMRQLLERDFDLKAIFDLGDTRMFHAAVLPAIVIATKKVDVHAHEVPNQCRFVRVKQDFESLGPMKISTDEQLLRYVTQRKRGPIKTDSGCFQIEYGTLGSLPGVQNQWRLDTPQSTKWLRKIAKTEFTTFGQVAKIKVGIKTTADSVFIADSESGTLPDSSLVRPLITHHDATRWRVADDCKTARQVLYPYDLASAKPTPVVLSKHASANRYLSRHRKPLSSRKYLIDAGRKWYEIWVPHQPNRWAQPKIVWPDISEGPRFFLDQSGAVVNGDCYWLQLNEGFDFNWMYLILAVSNSSVAVRFYDTMFHNKLYAGRRRFMTQYVSQFPLPDLNSPQSKLVIETVKRMLKRKTITRMMEADLDALVLDAFGLD